MNNNIYKILFFIVLIHTVLTKENQSNKEEITSYLLKGGTLDRHDEDGYSLLNLAIEYGNEKDVAWLLDIGADPNIKTRAEENSLSFACRLGHKNIVHLLLEKGADPNVKDENGNNCLVWASEKGYKDTVYSLLLRGSDINLRASCGYTALILAASNGEKDIVSFLIDLNADPFISGCADYGGRRSYGDQWNALDFARHKGHNEIVPLLENYMYRKRFQNLLNFKK